MTLCPISMFSRIFATARPAVPASHAGGNSETSSMARLPSSSVRWASMTRRMYAASRSPRLATTSARMTSSSAPRVSMSCALRWAIGLSAFFCMTVTGSSSEVDVAGAGRGRHTGLDEHAVAGRRGGEVAAAQVAHRSLAQRGDATEADSHPAARGHEHAGGLAGVEQRGHAVDLDDGAGSGKRNLPAFAGDQDVRAEPFGVQPRGLTGRVEVLFQRVEQTGGPACPGLAFGEVGHELLERRGVEQTVGVGVQLNEPDVPGRGKPAEFGTEDDVL